MKIISISRIKNEEDIIESFIRYHLNFIDEMVIIEDFSSDETYDILCKLKEDEKLPLHIYRNSKKPVPQQEVINRAFNIALNDWNADLIVPLDCDEFMVCKDGGNPREVLENLSSDKYYHAYWRTYLPNLEKNSFSLSDFHIIRDPIFDDRSKIIIPSALTDNYDVELTPGSHSLENKDIPFEFLDELRIAHIPIRSKMQCISKEVIGWLNNISNYYKDPRASWHQNVMYRMLLDSNGNLTDGQIMDYAKSYSSRRASDIHIEEFEHPFDVSFCENIDLKYTSEYRDKGYANILQFSEDLALKYAETEQILKDINEDIINENDADSDYLYSLEESYSNVKKELYVNKNNSVIRNKNFTGKIELKNDRINELKDIVAEKNDRITEFKGKIGEKNERVIELKNRISEKNGRIIELKQHVSQKNGYINKLEKENERLSKQNNDILNSKAWKLIRLIKRN